MDLTLVQIPHRSVSGDYRPSAVIRLTPAELSAQHEIDWMRYNDDGLGETLSATFQTPTGEHFRFEFHVQAPNPHTAIVTLCHSPAEADTLDTALQILGLTSADCTWLRDDIHFIPHDLIRQDDHGNQFCVGTYRRYADALAAQRQLTANFHKQEYWIQKSTAFH